MPFCRLHSVYPEEVFVKTTSTLQEVVTPAPSSASITYMLTVAIGLIVNEYVFVASK
jgi:hypothetical protein